MDFDILKIHVTPPTLTIFIFAFTHIEEDAMEEYTKQHYLLLDLSILK